MIRLITIAALGFCLICPAASPQEPEDLQIADRLIAAGNYASAHLQLQEAIQKAGLRPELVVAYVSNQIEHYFQQKRLETFYLRDRISAVDSSGSRVVTGRYPDRLLRKLLQQYPQNAQAHQLLGDFYTLQLDPASTGLNPPLSILLKTRTDIYNHYSRAVQLGCTAVHVNRWLAMYYSDFGQNEMARNYLIKNLSNGSDDPETWFHLARLSFSEKAYSDTYYFASQALVQQQQLSPEQQYEVTRLAALSLQKLGEEERFLEYMKKCIHLLPEEQPAYLALIAHYNSRQQFEPVEKLLRTMLRHNGYDSAGFKALEQYCNKHNDFLFGEALLEELMGVYENSDECMGNLYHYRGNLLYYQGFTKEAGKQWEISRGYFASILPENDIRFHEIGALSRESSMR